MTYPPTSRRPFGQGLLRAIVRAPLIVTLVTLAMIGVAALTFGISTRGAPHPTSGCAAPNLSVSHPYPVSGYWVYPRRDRCDWRQTLQQIHDLGGGTLLQFGPTLEARRVGSKGRVLTRSGRVDPEFMECTDNGLTCYQAALRALRAANPGNTIVQTYVYGSTEPFSASLLRCPPYDRRLVAGTRVYYRLLLPAANPNDSSCDFSRGKPYKLILVAGSTHDSVGMLLSEADRFHMQVFLGMPTAPANRAKPWMPALAHTDTLVAFTRRVLDVYAQRYGGHRSFRGFYQTFEVQLRRQPNTATLEVYSAQHSVVQAAFPTKDILISPYWDARRRVNSGTPPAEVKSGFIKVAQTGVDIIAPQDSRGTGKAALYWEHQASQQVDPHLQPVFGVGAATYGDAYYAPVRAYYRAAARGRDALERRGHSVELWATIEAFEPTADVECASFTNRGRTDKARLDRALTMAGHYPTKIISFMWDGLYTCHGGQSSSLAEQIAADWNRPIITGARRSGSGLVIGGYNLGGGTVTLSWQAGNGSTRTHNILVRRDGQYRPTAGRRSPMLPEPMEEVWVPVPRQGPPEGVRIQIKVTNGTGKHTANPYTLD